MNDIPEQEKALRERFLVSLAERVEDVRIALEAYEAKPADNEDALVMTLHQLAGSAAMLDYPEISKSARQALHTLARDDEDDADPTAPDSPGPVIRAAMQDILTLREQILSGSA